MLHVHFDRSVSEIIDNYGISHRVNFTHRNRQVDHIAVGRHVDTFIALCYEQSWIVQHATRYWKIFDKLKSDENSLTLAWQIKQISVWRGALHFRVYLENENCPHRLECHPRSKSAGWSNTSIWQIGNFVRANWWMWNVALKWPGVDLLCFFFCSLKLKAHTRERCRESTRTIASEYD